MDVFGSFTSSDGSGYSASQWDPLLAFNLSGRIENIMSSGRETADVGDDFTRYWISTGPNSDQSRWTMPTGSLLNTTAASPIGLQQTALPAPEPTSLLLLGTGWLGLVSLARRVRQ